MPELRECRVADFEQLWQLDQSCFSPEIAYSRDELAYYLQLKTATCLVAYDADHVRGFILGHRYRGDSGHIITIDVDPTLQRSGLGSTLIQALEEQFRSAGCKSILLEVAVNNHTALTFYKKHGYSVLKTLRRYYRGDLDALLMGKAIRPQDL